MGVHVGRRLLAQVLRADRRGVAALRRANCDDRARHEHVLGRLPHDGLAALPRSIDLSAGGTDGDPVAATVDPICSSGLTASMRTPPPRAPHMPWRSPWPRSASSLVRAHTVLLARRLEPGRSLCGLIKVNASELRIEMSKTRE